LCVISSLNLREVGSLQLEVISVRDEPAACAAAWVIKNGLAFECAQHARGQNAKTGFFAQLTDGGLV
jgi:hypothetical protein